jgi:hypothetical protein
MSGGDERVEGGREVAREKEQCAQEWLVEGENCWGPAIGDGWVIPSRGDGGLFFGDRQKEGWMG